MRQTGKLRGERIAAWTVVLIVHALFGVMLLRLPVPVRDARTMGSPLDLVWIAAPPRASSKPQQPAHARAVVIHRSKAGSRTAPLHDPSAPPAPVEVREVAAARSLSAVFVQQAVEAAVRQPPGAFEPDPLGNRRARLPGRAANTFRMRPAPSLAERVAMVGKLFGGTDDPCRSARDSINALSQAGDSRELQYALDYEQRFCR